ncbi:MAG: carbohydrate kinase family protein [Anaerolineae bacterium]|nr:carbohydrate kinase family protein [Anaerolineae bacterium]
MIAHVAFGIIVDDIVLPQGETHMGVLGGGGPQTAWGMAVARTGPSVGIVAGIGHDLEAGILAPLKAAHIDLSGIRTSDLPTPRAWQVLELNGRRTQVWRVPLPTLGQQLARRWDVLPAAYRNARTAHWGIHPGDTGSFGFARDLRAQGYIVSLEPFKPSDQPMDDAALNTMLTVCDIFSPNWHEASRIVGSEDYATVITRFKALGCRVLALRRGADGADVWDFSTGSGVHVPAVAAQVVDVVGAGNAFCGAFVARFNEGIATAACHASAAASYMIEQVGMPPALPGAADYARRLAEAEAGLTPLG